MPLEFDARVLGFSIQNAHFLAKACAAAALKDEGRIIAAVAELGLSETVRPFSVVVPDEITDFHGFIASNDESVFLAFRGTDNLQNWLTDGTIVQRPGYGGLVHKGFADAVDSVWPVLEPMLTNEMQGRDLWLTGHNLGAALAVLTAARLQEKGTDVEAVYTFGAPRVGNLSFYEAYHPITYRLVNNNDIIAHVPPEVVPVFGYRYFTYKHVGTLKYFDRHGLIDEGTSDWAVKKPLMREQLLRLGQPPTQWFQDHQLSSYVAAIENNL